MFRRKNNHEGVSSIWDEITNGDIASAIAEIERRIAEEGERYELLRVLGFAHCRQRDYDVAVGFFEKAYALRPTCGEAKLALVNAWMHLERYADVVAFMESQGGGGSLKLRKAYKKAVTKERDKTALFFYSFLQKLFFLPSFVRIRLIRKLKPFLVDSLDPESAVSRKIVNWPRWGICFPIIILVEVFRKAHKLNKAAPGWDMIEDGQFEEAAAYSEAMLPNADTSDRYALFRLAGFAFVRMQKYEEAKGYFQKALEIFPEDEKAMQAYADACYNSGAYADAIPQYTALLRKSPKEDIYRKRLQFALEKEGRDQELLLILSEGGLAFLPSGLRPVVVKMLSFIAVQVAEKPSSVGKAVQWVLRWPFLKGVAEKLGTFFESYLLAKAKEFKAIGDFSQGLRYYEAAINLSFSKVSGAAVLARMQAELLMEVDRTEGNGPYPSSIEKAKATEFLISVWADAKFDYRIGMQLATLLIKRKMPEVGLAVLERSTVPETKPLGFIIQTARCYLAMNQPQAAMEQIADLSSDARSNLSVMLLEADTELALGNPRAALKILVEADTSGNINMDRKRMRAALAYECGNAGDSFALLDTILQQKPDYAAGRKLQGIVRSAQGNSENIERVVLFDQDTVIPSDLASGWVALQAAFSADSSLPPNVTVNDTMWGIVCSEEKVEGTEYPEYTVARASDLCVFEGRKVVDVLPLLLKKLHVVEMI